MTAALQLNHHASLFDYERYAARWIAHCFEQHETGRIIHPAARKFNTEEDGDILFA